MDSDKRFAHISTDPKFRRIPKGARKVKIDKRFQSMFKDKKFNVKYTVDKRGRPVNHSTNEDLKRYYELSSGEESSDDYNVNPKENSDEESSQSEAEQDQERDDNEPGKLVKVCKDLNKDNLKQKPYDKKLLADDIKKKLKDNIVDYARGEGKLYSDSSSDEGESSEEEISEADEIDHKWGELDNDAEETLQITSRLAACNMDWDRIRAVDLIVLFNSFLSTGGSIESIKIYPSEFGKKRMAEEDVSGPKELTQSKEEPIDNDDVEGNKFHMEKLRQYQLNRLKYYYAVIICDNSTTANKIYTECDGMEYESSSTKIDLRFIPEEMTFDEEPKEECSTLPEGGKYKPRFFTTTALQQAKVDLTWDETNPERIEVAQKFSSGKVDDISEADLHTYLACSSSEDEDEEAEVGIKDHSDEEEEKLNPIDKYKALLQQIEVKEEEKKNKDVQMEVSWGIDLKEKTDKLVKQKMAEKEDKTPFQQYLDKRKDKRKEKRNKKKQNDDSESSDDIPSDVDINDPYFAEEFDKPEFKNNKLKKTSAKSSGTPKDDEDVKRKQAELELLLEEDPNGKKHFSLKKILDNETITKSKKKRKKNADQEKTEDNFEIDVQDERFAALYTSHHYNIDPTDPHFKKTKAMETLISEKINRRTNEHLDDNKKDVGSKKSKQTAELNVLVKSVKRKASAFEKKKK